MKQTFFRNHENRSNRILPQEKKIQAGIKKDRTGSARARLVFFGLLAFLLLLGSVFSEALAPYDPNLQDRTIAKAAPPSTHLLGTDRYGRDVLSRVIAGSRASIFSTLLLVAVHYSHPELIGVFCTWLERETRRRSPRRISDIFLAFPGLVFAMAVAGLLGGGLHNAIIALAAISWPKYARIARSQTLAQRETAYLKAARLAGSGTVKISSYISAQYHGADSGHIHAGYRHYDDGTGRAEFSGTGRRKPPTAEWGSMMSDARGLMTTAPPGLLFHRAALRSFLSVMVFNLLGDTVRDLRGSQEQRFVKELFESANLRDYVSDLPTLGGGHRQMILHPCFREADADR